MPNRHTHYGAARSLPSPPRGARPAKQALLESRAAARLKRVRGTRRP